MSKLTCMMCETGILIMTFSEFKAHYCMAFFHVYQANTNKPKPNIQ